jgi:hypothetical protein
MAIVQTGPLGRLARFALMVGFVVLFFSIVDQRGSARFRNPHVLTEPTVWVFTALMYVIFVILVGVVAKSVASPRAARKWQVGAVIASLVAIAGAAVVGAVMSGSAWGFPLADGVWWFDVLVIVEQVVAFVIAIALGILGCEIGVWGMSLARARGRTPSSETGLACIVGLHLLDSWEARRRGSGPAAS